MEFKKEKVAVLLATYNGEKWLDLQIQSIIAQRYVEIKIFASDDFSSDDSINTLKKYSDDIEILPILKSGGAAQNFLRLIEHVDISEFNFVALADQDDIWDQYKIISAINIIKSGDLDAYSSSYTSFWDNGIKLYKNKSRHMKEFDYIFESPGPGCTFVIKPNLIEELKKYIRINNKLTHLIAFHDSLIYFFARSNNYKWFIDSSSYISYRQHNSNVLGANIGITAARKRLSALRKGWLLSQIIVMSEFCDFENKIIQRIKRLNLIDRIYLFCNSFKFRRKSIDSIALAISFLFCQKPNQNNSSINHLK